MIWLIGLGGSIGAASRYGISKLLNRKNFPVGTLSVNVLGSFLLGLLANFYLAEQISDWLWFFWGVGFCGAFTTFSTFGYETITYLLEQRVKLAIFYVLISAIASLVAASLGFLI